MDLLGTKKLVEIIRQATGVIVPETEEALEALTEGLTSGGVVIEQVGDLVEDIDALLERMTDAPKWVKELMKELTGAGNTANRVMLRAGNTMRGLFPLTIKWYPSQPKSPLAALLAGPDGEPGAVIFELVPHEIPG